MNQHQSAPRKTNDGVLFTVIVDSIKHECLIKKEALKQLTALANTDTSIDTIEVFLAFENRISGVARRLVAAGVPNKPLVLTSSTFVSQPHPT
ncbi:DUF1488 family protein [Oxalicibacterium solurbis]|uniref:Uncharacterized protein n=1 Tax=Oxalicibacterium solurbis TaxID=69280 RepID=A0A8J3F483_9BURK|nr:DUF1488 family protein [Oxalicibacterium solurbis]GGI54272.1 hypothetical protein GCM10011430_14460 [Oxalicibacterium solurbis]